MRGFPVVPLQSNPKKSALKRAPLLVRMLGLCKSLPVELCSARFPFWLAYREDMSRGALETRRPFTFLTW